MLSNNRDADKGDPILTYLFTKDDFAIDFYFDTNETTDGRTGRRFTSDFNVTNPSNLENPLFFTLDGTFDTNGVLRGRTFLSRANQTQGQGIDGYITGLVGAEGVVASFASISPPGGDDFGHYVGGFVAVPTNADGNLPNREKTDVNYLAWTTGAVKELTPKVVTIDPDTLEETITPATYGPLTFLPRISSTNKTDEVYTYFVKGGATGLIGDETVTIATFAFGTSYGRVRVNYADDRGSNRDLSIPIILTLGDVYSHVKKKDDKTVDTRDFNLGGDVANGISFVHGTVDSTNEPNQPFYTGILSGTDLGTPILTSASGKWKGRFYLYAASIIPVVGHQNSGLTEAVDFTLTVAFDAGSTTTGTIKGTTNVIDDLNNNTTFTIGGRFNAAGIISGGGTVNYSGNNIPWVLSGLIGSEGLVAVFAGERRPAGHFHYVIGGGFVARPENDVAETTGTLTTADWISGFAFNDRPLISAFDKDAHFLRGDSTGLATTGFDSLPVTQRFLRLDNDNKDGVSFFAGEKGGTTRYYAGLLSTTDVGLPLDSGSTATATWSSKIGVILGNTYSSATFNLTVDFNEHTIKNAAAITLGNKTNVNIDASWVQTSKIAITGTTLTGGTALTEIPFGRIRGKITGLDTVAGTLTGIIGRDGAVGAFISGAGSTAHYAGGFVAKPPAIIGDSVSYNDWIGRFDTIIPYTEPTPFSVGDYAHNQFLQSTGAIVPTKGIVSNYANGAYSGDVTATLLKLDSVGGDASDGVAFFSGYYDYINNDSFGGNDNYSRYITYYGGILNTTNLGAPLTQTDGTATWNGKFRAIGTGKAVPETDFELKVTFGNTPGAAGKVEAFVEQNSANNTHYHLNGTYDSNGVISGFVDFGAFSGDSNIDAQTPTAGARLGGELQGLIGQEGAVGVFISRTSNSSGDNGYAGGFVARPAQ